MAGSEIDVVGAKRLRASLAKMGVDVKDLKEVHQRVSSFVGAEGAQRAPRSSGMLAASWRPGATKTDAVVRFGGARAPYANAVHWGTGARAGKRGPHNIPRNPFAWRATFDTEPTWLDFYMDELNRMLANIEGAPTSG